MTPIQRKVLNAIRDLTVDSVSPSYDEIARQVGLSSRSRVHAVVHQLHGEGFIRFSEYGSRNIQIVADDRAYTPARLADLSAEALRDLIATASGLLAHKDGEGRTDETLRRIGDRLVGRPRVRA